MERRASDIHIEPMQNQVRVRYRIDGELFTAAKIEKEKQSQIIGRLKAISNMHQEKQESQDGRILLMKIIIFVYLHNQISMVRNLF